MALAAPCLLDGVARMYRCDIYPGFAHWRWLIESRDKNSWLCSSLIRRISLEMALYSRREEWTPTLYFLTRLIVWGTFHHLHHLVVNPILLPACAAHSAYKARKFYEPEPHGT